MKLFRWILCDALTTGKGPHDLADTVHVSVALLHVVGCCVNNRREEVILCRLPILF